MRKVLLLVAVFAALAIAGSGTLTAVCTDCGSGGDPAVVINGTGYQSGGGHNQLTVVVYDSPNPVSCTTYKNGSFTCNTNIDAPGWYSIVAYQNSKTVIAATVIYVY